MGHIECCIDSTRSKGSQLITGKLKGQKNIIAHNIKEKEENILINQNHHSRNISKNKLNALINNKNNETIKENTLYNNNYPKNNQYKLEIKKEEELIDVNYLNNIKKVYSQSPKLDIEILNSVILKKGEIIELDPFGMINNSLRNERDGYTFFGYFPPNYSNKIDVMLKPKEPSFEERFIGKHFQIKFNPYTLKYHILDLGCGFGTFKKLLSQTNIKDNFFINIGNSYIVFTYNDDDKIQNLKNENLDILFIKVFSPNINYEKISFNPLNKSKLYIGRDLNNDVCINDELLSRIHCTVFYKENFGWLIKDGNIKDNNLVTPSTNGTWLMINEDTEINDNMIFKSNQNLFKCIYKYDN